MHCTPQGLEDHADEEAAECDGEAAEPTEPESRQTVEEESEEEPPAADEVRSDGYASAERSGLS